MRIAANFFPFQYWWILIFNQGSTREEALLTEIRVEGSSSLPKFSLFLCTILTPPYLVLDLCWSSWTLPCTALAWFSSSRCCLDFWSCSILWTNWTLSSSSPSCSSSLLFVVVVVVLGVHGAETVPLLFVACITQWDISSAVVGAVFAISTHCCVHLCIASSFSISKTLHLLCNKAGHRFITLSSPQAATAALITLFPASPATTVISPSSSTSLFSFIFPTTASSSSSLLTQSSPVRTPCLRLFLAFLVKAPAHFIATNALGLFIPVLVLLVMPLLRLLLFFSFRLCCDCPSSSCSPSDVAATLLLLLFLPQTLLRVFLFLFLFYLRLLLWLFFFLFSFRRCCDFSSSNSPSNFAAILLLLLLPRSLRLFFFSSFFFSFRRWCNSSSSPDVATTILVLLFLQTLLLLLALASNKAYLAEDTNYKFTPYFCLSPQCVSAP